MHRQQDIFETIQHTEAEKAQARVLLENIDQLPGKAKTVLARVKNTSRRNLLVVLLLESGVQTGPALEYGARLLAWMCDGSTYPAPPVGLKPQDAIAVQGRMREMVKAMGDDPRLIERGKGPRGIA